MKKKPRNKKYRPKRLDPNATYEAIMLAQPISAAAKQEMLDGVHVALFAISKGVGTVDHFDKLAMMIDVTNILINGLFKGADYSEYVNQVNEARNGLIRSRDRHAKTKRIILDGPGLNALNSVVDIYEAVMSNVTGHEFVRVVAERERQLKLGNYFKGTYEDLKQAA